MVSYSILQITFDRVVQTSKAEAQLRCLRFSSVRVYKHCIAVKPCTFGWACSFEIATATWWFCLVSSLVYCLDMQLRSMPCLCTEIRGCLSPCTCLTSLLLYILKHMYTNWTHVIWGQQKLLRAKQSSWSATWFICIAVLNKCGTSRCLQKHIVVIRFMPIRKAHSAS